MSIGWQLEHVLAVLLVYHLLRILWSQRPSSAQTQKKKGPPRQWRPKTPRDCPACQEGVKLTLCRVKRQVTPWSQVKSRRGKKKTIPTQGYACPNPDCHHYGITDATIHALVGNGKDGQNHDILNCVYGCWPRGWMYRFWSGLQDMWMRR